MLSASIFRQRFEPIAGRHSKIVERPRVVDKTELSQRHRLDIRRKPSAASTFPDRCCLSKCAAGRIGQHF